MDLNNEDTMDRIRELERRMSELKEQMKEQVDRLEEELRKSGWK